jgi:diguanylate cyclase (GGDEF)-like protein
MKILVVEADHLFARLLTTKLERWGHTVVVESNGAAAYERIRREPFRMVILDWDLEQINGPELCSRIRKLRRSRYTYILFYTSRSDKDTLLAGLEAGADAYLTKPLNTVELRLRMKNGKRLLNLEDELREGASRDRVTGIVNRNSFDQFFRVILADAVRTGSQGTLMYVTVSNFRDVYDDKGYMPAQNMMIDIARQLSEAIRESDLVARVEEDEFCALLQNTYWDKCEPFVTRVYERLHDLTVYVDDVNIQPQIAMSMVNYPLEGVSYEQLLRGAERIPYRGAA